MITEISASYIYIIFEKDACMKDSTIIVGITLVSTMDGASTVTTVSLMCISVLDQAVSFAMQGHNVDTKQS